jgi:DNA-binding transcriptional LysR family regulator
MLNPNWLLTFAAMNEEQSFTKTGIRLGMTQAAVSQHIRQLETQLGPLLIRRSRRIEMTPAGLALLEYCRESQQAEKRLHQRLTQSEDAPGEVGLITPGSIGLSLYSWLLALQAETPGLVVRHRFAPNSEVLSAILENSYDLGLVTLRPDDVRLTATRFAEEPLELVLPKNFKMSGWNDLVKLGFIDHPDGISMATRFLSRQFPGAPGIRHVPRTGFSNQIGLILEPVAMGLGFTVIPRYARQAFARQDALHIVQGGPEAVDTLWLIHRSEWPLSNSSKRVLDYLRVKLAN